MLDVGHGTSVVVRAPGPWTLLFDAGSRSRPGLARETLGPLLRRWEVRAPRVVVSHLDRDHAGALPWLISRFGARWLAGARDAELERSLPRGTPCIDLDGGLLDLGGDGEGQPRLALLRGLSREDNEGSRSLVVHHGGQLVLLCGDAEEKGLEASLRSRTLAAEVLGTPPGARTVLLPHHGAASEAVAELVSLLQPGRAWISCEGEPEVLELLEELPGTIQWTGAHGPLRLGSLLGGALPEGVLPEEPAGGTHCAEAGAGSAAEGAPGGGLTGGGAPCPDRP